MTIKRKAHPYYDFRKIDSYQAFIKIICGGRGLGKTFGFKKKGIKKATTTGEQFMYVRRTLEELKAAKLTFFTDVQEFFPDWEFRINGSVGEASRIVKRKKDEEEASFKKRMKSRKWIIVCHFKALSVAQQQKSTAFPLVTSIGFDEFIIERSSQTTYLRKEVEALINLYFTVDRGQDKTVMFLLANSVSIMNPYFSYWDIQPDQLPELSIHADGDIVVHLPDSKDYQKSIYQTRFGQFISREMPEYADYAVGNEFKDANSTLIDDKTKDAKYKYTIETENGFFSVWYDMKQGKHFILAKRPGNERILTMVPENMDKGKLRVTNSDGVIKTLRASFNRGSVIFDRPATRNAFVPIFDRK